MLICTVTKVDLQGVFVSIDEYAIQGMIHISEIAPGRIRNIRDYVKEGKVIVCKALRINQERRQVDLSLRRVTESQKREKNEQIKQEMTAEKIVQFLADELKKELKNVYSEIADRIFEDYEFMYEFFDDVVSGEANIYDYIKDKTVGAELEKLIRQRIKLPEVEIKGEFSLISYAPDGVSMIKQTLSKAKDEHTQVKYKGAGKYSFSVKAPDFKSAEKFLDHAVSSALEFAKRNDIHAEFVRLD